VNPAINADKSLSGCGSTLEPTKVLRHAPILLRARPAPMLPTILSLTRAHLLAGCAGPRPTSIHSGLRLPSGAASGAQSLIDVARAIGAVTEQVAVGSASECEPQQKQNSRPRRATCSQLSRPRWTADRARLPSCEPAPKLACRNLAYNIRRLVMLEQIASA
jgi:hypothetical protein